MLKERVQAEVFSPSRGWWWSRGWGQEVACPVEAGAARAVSAGGSLEQGWVLGSDWAVPSPSKQGSHTLPPPTNMSHIYLTLQLKTVKFNFSLLH